jgi:hypothetical protein
MAIQNPWHIAAAQPKPVKPLQNPFHIANANGGDVVSGAMPQPFAPPAPPPAPVAPPPPDFNALINADPGYTTGNEDNLRQNKLAMDRLLQNFKTTSQGYQDNANAHGALFSGAAVNAQRSAGQSYSDSAAQQAANYAQNQNQIYTSAWQRILNQLAGGS